MRLPRPTLNSAHLPENFMQKIGTLLLCALPIALSACGGKSGGDTAQSRQQDMEAARQEIARRTAATQHLDYPVKQAMQSILARDEKLDRDVDGELVAPNQATKVVHGHAALHITAMTPATYEGAPADHNTLKVSGSVKIPGDSRGMPLDAFTTDYYDADLNFLGFRTAKLYCAATKSPGYPVSLKTGTDGLIASFDCYSDATKAVYIGRAEISYIAMAGKDETMLFAQLRKFEADHEKQSYALTTIYKIKPNGHIALAGMGFITDQGGVRLDVGDMLE